MKLGNYDLNRPVFMAPMAGVTDKAFRETIRLTGGRYSFTEMISDKALLYKNSKTIRMLDLSGEDEPRIVQIFGSESEDMARAARIAVEYGANVIDINMGCPTPKIVKNCEGAALLRDLSRATKIAASVVKTVNVPVTAKIRLGWDYSSIVALELASRLEAVGIRMITVHARTKEQYYSGKADWSWIRKIKSNIGVPIIGNGDILSPYDAQRMLAETGCDGVMIARGALGNPWLIGRTQYFLETGEVLPEPDNRQKCEIVMKHLERVISYKGAKVGIKEIRKHAAWYTKGIRGAAEYRNEIMSAQNPKEMESIFFKAFLEESEGRFTEN